MINWGVDDDWRFDYYPLDVGEDAFPLHAQALRIWRKRGQGGIPAWTDFDLPMDFEGLWGWLSVYDSIPEHPYSFVVRLWGTSVAVVAGYDATGTRLTAALADVRNDASTITEKDLGFCRFVLDESVIGHQYGPLRQELGEMVRYEEIVLPLSSDGITNDKALFFGVRIDLDDS